MSEFNTYDILKQRYLVLTREALTALKERVKDEPPPPRFHRRDPTGRRPGELSPWSPSVDLPSTSVPGPSSTPTRWSSGP